MAHEIGRLHVLTDFTLQQRFDHDELAKLAIEGGADLIQFRHKSGTLRHKLDAAQNVADCCANGEVPVVINDHIDIMLATDADGVHLGQRDFPIAEARSIVGDRIIGATATTAEQAKRCEDDGADYIGFGPVYDSDTKNRPSSVKGLAGLERAVKSVSIPVIAISGITPERVKPALDAGAHGVAVLSGIALSDNPRAATEEYRQAIDHALK